MKNWESFIYKNKKSKTAADVFHFQKYQEWQIYFFLIL